MGLDFVDLNTIEFSKLFGNDKDEPKIEDKDIAIIGASCRLGNKDDMKELWDSLMNGECMVNELSNRRKQDIELFLRKKGVDTQSLHYTKGAYLKDVDLFDNEFFHISPAEAMHIDPNQRLFLETAWHALEDAGYANEDISNSNIGIYVGYSDDFSFSYKDFEVSRNKNRDGIGFTGNLRQMIASRLAYFLNTKGPCMMIDTGCSSSLTAIHVACKAIQNGECNMAFAGGIKINLLPIMDVMDRGVDISSKDGKTKTFDYDSDGTGFGEGVGVVLLKSCKQAYKDNDQIFAVIKGSALNQDGHSVGITAPNMQSQEEVIKAAWKSAGVNGDDVCYIEAHGTGTQLGDTIEIGALENVYRSITNRKQFIGIGSIKSNLGHLDGAAGMAGIIKCILSIKNQLIPPTIHFARPNDKIDFMTSPVYVVTSPLQLSDAGGKNKIAVSSFGIGGSNCHMILGSLEDSLEKRDLQNISYNYNIFVLSARTKASLMDMMKKYILFLSENDSYTMEDMCFTLCNGRMHMKNRLAIVFREKQELIRKLSLVYDEAGSSSSFCYEDIYYQEDFPMVEEPTVTVGPDILSQNVKVIGEILGEKYVSGYRVDFKSVYPCERYHKVSLPLYAFDKKRFWYAYDMEDQSLEEQSALAPQKINSMEKCTKEKFADLMRICWKSVFGYQEIKNKDNFFEIGGDSISASQITNYVNQTFSFNITMQVLLGTPVFEDFVNKSYDLYDNQWNMSENKVKHAQYKEYFPLSEAQRRLYILSKGNIGDLSMNIPNMISIKGELDLDRLQEAFMLLIERHESLRTSICMVKGEVMQRLHDPVEFSLKRHYGDEHMIPEIIKNFVRPFGMDENSLFHAEIIELEKNNYILMLDFHHIIVDGTSINIFTQELFQIYNGKKFDMPEYTYKDYVLWSKDFMETSEYKKMEEYWTEQFSDFEEQKHIPYDYANEEGNQHIGDIYSYELGQLETERLLEFREKNNTTLYIIIMSAFGICLSRYLGSDDIIIGSAVMGRNRKEFENMVGLFINILPIRMKIDKNSSYEDYLKTVKETVLQGLIHQDYPYTQLVQKLKTKNRLPSDNLFNITFIMQNTMLYDENLDESLQIEPYSFADEGIVGDLILETRYTKDKIWVIIKYCKDLFCKETIEDIGNTLHEILKKIPQLEKHFVSELISRNEMRINEELMNFNEQLEE